MHFAYAADLKNPYIEPLIETECVATEIVCFFFLRSNIINIYAFFSQQPPDNFFLDVIFR